MSKDTVFSAIGDATRRSILELLHQENELPIRTITKHFDISRQAISKHLSVLEDAGLIRFRSRGRERLCTADPKALKHVSKWLDQFGFASKEATQKAVPSKATVSKVEKKSHPSLGDLDAYLKG